MLQELARCSLLILSGASESPKLCQGKCYPLVAVKWKTNETPGSRTRI